MDYFAGYNAMPKYVVSSTVSDPEWNNTTVLSSLDEVAELKAGEGGPILVHGSLLLTQGLLAAGLVDEMRLMVFPVILGSGRTLFPTDAADKVKLTLAESTAYGNGVQFQVFRPRRLTSTGRSAAAYVRSHDRVVRRRRDHARPARGDDRGELRADRRRVRRQRGAGRVRHRSALDVRPSSTATSTRWRAG